MIYLVLIVTLLIAVAAIGGLTWSLLTNRQLRQRFGPVVDLDAEQRRIERELEQLNKLKTKTRATWEKEYATTIGELETLSGQLDHVRDQVTLESYGLYTPQYEFADSNQYKDRLSQVRDHQKHMIRMKTAAVCPADWEVEGSKTKGRQMTQRNLRLQLRAFNGECDAAISKVKYSNVRAIEERIGRAFDAINKLGETNKCSVTIEYRNLKLQELYLAHEFQEKKQAEKEEQRQIREQMREEARAEKEIEKACADAERDEQRYEQALNDARNELQSASEAKQAKLNEKIAALQTRLDEAHANKDRAISRAQMTKSGHVYVISNVGSFGEDVFKIGMTRRLEPLDRVKELGDASVPFPFDIHAMIYSENAPEMESALHRYFNEHRVNLVNTRKEYFHIGVNELETVVRQHGGDIEFTLIAEAEEYHKSLAIREQNNSTPTDALPDIEVLNAKHQFEERMRLWKDDATVSAT